MADLTDIEFPDREADQLERLKEMRDEGEKWRDSWSKSWDRNVGTIRGDLWPDKGSKPTFLANIISPTVRRKAGLLTEAKPGIDIRAVKNGLQKTADVLQKTAVAVLDAENSQLLWEMISYYFAAFGPGFIKVGWDRFKNYGNGDITVSDVDPRLMIIDPIVRRSTDLTPECCQYVLEDSVVPFSWVQRHFPRTAKKVDPNYNIKLETNDTHKIGAYEKLIDRLKKRTKGEGSDSAVPRIYIQQCWVADNKVDKDGNLIYPGGRRIFLTGDDVILNPNPDPTDLVYGQANPYWDGLYPYIMLDNEPDLDHPFGHPEVDALRKINEAFNAIGHMTTRTMIKNVPWIIADQNAIDDETLQDIKELEEVVVQKAPGRTVERTPPTQPSTTNIQFMQLLITLIEMYSGLNDGALQGKGRVELRSAPQLEGLQQAQQVLIRAQARRLESAIERLGQLLISRIFQYYTDDRILVYVDQGQIKEYNLQKDALRGEIVQMAQKAAEQEAAEQTTKNIEAGVAPEKAYVEPKLTEDRILEHVRGAWRLFRFKVLPFSTLASTKIQRALAMEQLASGGLIPQSMVTKEAGFDNFEELQQQVAKEMKFRESLGIPPPQPPKSTKGGQKK